MAKLAVLEIESGSFATGFAVKLQVGEDGAPCSISLRGQLPPAPDVLSHYESWQLGYSSWGKGFRNLKRVKQRGHLSVHSQSPFRQIQAVPGSTRQRSNLKVLSSELERVLNEWLDSGDRAFQKIRDQLLKTFSTQESVRLIIQADQLTLWQLPWELWHLVQGHPNVGIALSKREYAPIESVLKTRATVRILVLLGDSTGLDIQKDLNLLQQYLPSEVDFYAPEQVEQAQLSDDLWMQSWDILFFAGHSSSWAGEGRLYLTDKTYLTIPDLKYALNRAIAQGLKLAIFNSCQGLEVARALADLQLPATIVMRERIPDKAAQKFLDSFLKAFAQEELSLHASVRDACQQLQGWENNYPCVSWLPLICQNPAAPILWWRSFLPTYLPTLPAPIPLPETIFIHRPRRLKARFVLLISLVVACLVMGVRTQGYLQPLELKAYDHLMQLRPIEGADPRLLVVQITDADEQRQNAQKEPGTGSLHDPTLQKLLTVLDKHQPAAIGIDIYRDQYEALASRLQDSQHTPIVGICEHPQFVSEFTGLGQPKPVELSTNQVGFSNFSYDRDAVSRRHQLRSDSASSRSQCEAPLAFSLQVALHYLHRQKIKAEVLPNNLLKLKDTVFHRLESHVGGYQTSAVIPSSLYFILLNYRPYRRLDQIAESMPLQQILDEKFSPNAIKDKVILIGRVDNEPRTTPYNAEYAELVTPGVYLHAQAVSQILSAVLNSRPLIWWLPVWGDFLWMWMWTAIVGTLTLQVLVAKPWWLLAISTAGSLLLLYLSCGLGMLLAAWLPLIPSGLAMLITSFWVATSYYWQPQRKIKRQSL